MGDAENAVASSKKRVADMQISKENPEVDDDTPETEMGTFQRASEEVLATRKIVKIRRQQPSSNASPNPFAGIRFVSLADSTSKASPHFGPQDLSHKASTDKTNGAKEMNDGEDREIKSGVPLDETNGTGESFENSECNGMRATTSIDRLSHSDLMRMFHNQSILQSKIGSYLGLCKFVAEARNKELLATVAALERSTIDLGVGECLGSEGSVLPCSSCGCCRDVVSGESPWCCLGHARGV